MDYSAFAKEHELEITVKDRVALVKFNRPHVRNQMTYAMHRGIERLLPDLGIDPDVGAIVLTGSGTDFTVGISNQQSYKTVKGLGLAVGGDQGMLQDDYDFTAFPETYHVAIQAYQEAGITNPRKELSLVELHDCFTITELITYEDLQIAPRGKGTADVAAGTFTLEGELPVNPDGGLKCFGHPIGASGIRMVYEAYKQIQGKAGPRQIKDAKLALAHSLGGVPRSFAGGVSIVGRADTK